MSTYDDALIEKAAWELYVWRSYELDQPHSETPWNTRDERIVRPAYMAEVRAVLDAVADDLRAEGWDEGWEAADGDHALEEPPSSNPYRRERA